MKNIELLDKSVYELIAAGEVIDRPASVVKELIENSIDAGASSITVEIKNGGISFLRISDDGAGIPFEQCPMAFLRHATSKVRKAEDLVGISTMGFRGEALASVAAVARVSLLTKTANSLENMGASYKIEGGVEIEHTRAGCPDGTTIIVRDLFFNTPARLKFLKKDVSEGNYVQSVLDKAALINPQIAFRFIRDNKLVRVTPGDGKTYSAMYAIFGKCFAQSMLPVDCSQNGIHVSGYVSAPLFCRSNRAFQNFYVNSRYVRNSTCIAALEEGYRNSVMTGKFPACVLNITLNPADTDINVHPAKTEVRFAQERVIFSAINVAVKNGILNSMQDSQVESVSYESGEMPVRIPETLTLNSPKTEYSISSTSAQPEPLRIQVEYKHLNPDSFIRREKSANPVSFERACFEEDYGSGADFRVIGELFSTYIMCEQGDELVLIDKHAADERLRFERLKKRLRSDSQFLIEPIDVRIDVETFDFVSGAVDDLEQIGLKIDCEECEDSQFVRVKAMPLVIGNSPKHAEELLVSIADSLKSAEKISLGSLSVVDEIVHRIACRSAVKAGDKSDALDLKQLAERVISKLDLRYCPHGRPICVRMSKKEFEKKFKRMC
ncbi:MAG: DNA mismatch repair endonuclease MutL [Oscillospiraceae bacterium]|nr:DNA mismatch repair endonuclease MutL [Oscillospiraceae bacterium]